MFEIGQHFAQNYPDSVDEMERLQSTQPFYANVVNNISTIFSNPTVALSRERLKQWELHCPNLPNKPIQAEVVNIYI